jgi:hypothetical protein
MKDWENNWKSLFLPRGFDMKKALKEYEDESSTPLEQLLNLHDFVVIERAKAMYEKLWARCSEAYLLGTVDKYFIRERSESPEQWMLLRIASAQQWWQALVSTRQRLLCRLTICKSDQITLAN